jgi:hypothetical protein
MLQRIRQQARRQLTSRSARRASAWQLCWFLCIACGSAVSPIRRLPPGVMDFLIVPRPPPVVPLEIQPERPDPRAVWVEGSWTWSGGEWSWSPGAWVVPAPGSSLSPWTYSYQEDGRVRFWATRWQDAAGRSISAPTPVAVAKRRLDVP